MPTIPFEVQEQGGRAIAGLLFVEEGFLVFDLQEGKCGIFRRRAPEKVKAELGLIDHIHLSPGLLTDSLYIVPRRSDLLKAIPGTHKGELRLRVAKRHREQAQTLVAEVLEQLHDRRTRPS